MAHMIFEVLKSLQEFSESGDRFKVNERLSKNLPDALEANVYEEHGNKNIWVWYAPSFKIPFSNRKIIYPVSADVIRSSYGDLDFPFPVSHSLHEDERNYKSKDSKNKTWCIIREAYTRNVFGKPISIEDVVKKLSEAGYKHEVKYKSKIDIRKFVFREPVVFFEKPNDSKQLIVSSSKRFPLPNLLPFPYENYLEFITNDVPSSLIPPIEILCKD